MVCAYSSYKANPLKGLSYTHQRCDKNTQLLLFRGLGFRAPVWGSVIEGFKSFFLGHVFQPGFKVQGLGWDFEFFGPQLAGGWQFGGLSSCSWALDSSGFQIWCREGFM